MSVLRVMGRFSVDCVLLFLDIGHESKKGTMTMKIEKNVPIPSDRKIRSVPRSYNWPEMQIGDSVFFDDEPKASQSLPCIAAKTWGTNNGRQFSSRKEGNGVRIWRVA